MQDAETAGRTGLPAIFYELVAGFLSNTVPGHYPNLWVLLLLIRLVASTVIPCTLHCMTGDDLNRDQYARIHAKFMQASRDLYTLRQWMEKHRFSLDDPLFRVTFAAQHAMHQLECELHKKAFGHLYGRSTNKSNG